MPRRHQRPPASACAEPDALRRDTSGVPDCSTGPAGRLGWTLSEILRIIRHRG